MKVIIFAFNFLVFLLPLVFFPRTSEIFEFNKMVVVYAFTIFIVYFWIIEMIRKKKIIYKQSPLNIPILIFLVSQLIATIITIDQRTSLLGYYGRFHGGFLSYVSYALLYFAFISFMDQKKVVKIIQTLVVSVSIVSIWAILEHFGKSLTCLAISGSFDSNCFVQNLQERVFATLGQPNWLAAVLVAVVPFSWAGVVGKKNSSAYIAIAIVMFLALLFTKSRSGLLGFSAALIAFWGLTYYEHKNITKEITLGFVTIITISIIGLFFVWNPLSKALTPPQEGVTESGQIRQIVWEGAFDLWKKHPLTGTGVETFAHSYYETRPTAHNLTSEWNYLYNKAHNEYLNFAATTGTIGLAAYVLLIIISIKSLLLTRSHFGFALTAGYLSLVITNFFGFSTVVTGLLFFLFPAMSIKLNES